MDQTAELLARLHEASEPEQREQLVNQVVVLNMALANNIARRYSSRGIPLDDLRQVAYVALVRATKNYDITTGHHFLAYCVPTIRGEIRRHFRDHGWMVRPPRRIQDLQGRLSIARSELSSTLGRSPRPRELAAHLSEPVEDVIEALSGDGCFAPASLDRPTGGSGTTPLGDLIGQADREQGSAEARLVLAPLVRRLEERDRHILMLRFFRGWTQQEIAEDIGVTQMQVSRLLSRILTGLRNQLVTEAGAVDGAAVA
ncbi:MAG: sigma-70 family RNA polymerase sigma factor [Marmoricola sp.]